MDKSSFHVLGIMSGTSLDGIDLAEVYLSISGTGAWDFKIIAAETRAYPFEWKQKLKEAIYFSDEKLETLNNEYTTYLSKVIKTFIDEHLITDLDAVCSHGHTILHQPQNGLTLQIGNLPELAKQINQTVVCDFRAQDVLFGGQGAPLVPIGDRLLFGQYDYCLNLGGFANLSFEKKEQRIAYDICPVNIVLNKYAEKLGFPYDNKGSIASKGSLNKALLEKLNSLEFYKQSPPKSLGLEWVQQNVLPILATSGIAAGDIIRTFTEHAAIQIANQFTKGASVLITGGGTFNDFLISRIQATVDIELVIPTEEIIEYKEALIFALLGVLKLRGEINCLSSVTGAKKDHSSGRIFKKQ